MEPRLSGDHQFLDEFFSDMSFTTVKFPLYPSSPVFIAYYNGVESSTLTAVKKQLINRNSAYNYCFLSTTYIVSLEQLRCALHKAVQNIMQQTMKANSINTEIIFNLSPVNNMNDALKRFGVDENRSDVIVIKVCEPETDLDALENAIYNLLDVKASPLTDATLPDRFDEKKFKKLFKMLESEDASQQAYTRGAIAASLLRGL